MTVREQLMLLSRLGQIDLKLKDLKEKRKMLPQKANEAKDESLNLSVKEQALKSQSTDLELKRKLIDLEIQTEKGNLRKWEARADKIKGEREYTTLMSEIGSQKRVISNLETKALELMEEQEKLKNQLSASAQTLEKAKSVYEEEWSKVKEDIQVLQAELDQVEQAKSEITASMPQALLRRYEQIAQKRVGVGIAFLEKGICQSCKRVLPPELCNRIAKGEVLESCPACQRLLVTENLGV